MDAAWLLGVMKDRGIVLREDAQGRPALHPRSAATPALRRALLGTRLIALFPARRIALLAARLVPRFPTGLAALFRTGLPTCIVSLLTAWFRASLSPAFGSRRRLFSSGRDARGLAGRLGDVPRLESAHPSPLSARGGFFGSRPFSRANELLVRQGADPVDWRLP